MEKSKKRSNILEKLGIDLSPVNKETRGFFKGFITEYTRNIEKFNSEEVQEYFNNFIAALMLEYHKAYENFDVQVPYRIKSPKSALDKVLNYLSRDDKSYYEYNEHEEYQGKLKEDLTDMFAITIVGCNRPPTFYSNDPEINSLIEEKKRNHALLGEMQKFELKIKTDEFAGNNPKKAYKFNCSREEYYLNSIMLIERIKTMIDPSATSLLKKYDKLLENIKAKVPAKFFDICDKSIVASNNLGNLNNSDKLMEKYREMYDTIDSKDTKDADWYKGKITPEDIECVNFFGLVEDFTARIHDKLDLALLTKQVYAVFDNSELLSKFGISIDKKSAKKKRTAKGYVSNFAYLKTPFGKVEMQIQSQHENKEGNYGYAAHSEMMGKGFKEFDIPDLDNQDELRDFRTCVGFISPKKFFAQFDNAEPNRILTQVFGEYQNYKSIMSQVKKGSKDDLRLTKYFGKLYQIKNQIFPNEDKNEKIESFIEYDIDEYLKSENFKRIMGQSMDKEDSEEIEY